MDKDLSWIRKVIRSCENEAHLSYISALIDLFDRKHGDQEATESLVNDYLLRKSEIGVVPEQTQNDFDDLPY